MAQPLPPMSPRGAGVERQQLHESVSSQPRLPIRSARVTDHSTYFNWHCSLQRPTLLHLEKGSSRLFLLDLCNIRHTNSYIIHLSMYLFTQEAFIDVPLYACIFRDAEMVATMNKRQIPCPCGAHILMGQMGNKQIHKQWPVMLDPWGKGTVNPLTFPNVMNTQKFYFI